MVRSDGNGLMAPNLTDLPNITPDDIVIAVMGVTGSGKSTFIQYFTRTKLVIGHSLESCTSQVGIFSCSLPNGKKLFLVDTPGFDDSYKSDIDILREIANWLVQAFENKIQLTGIVYLHRILDVKLGGSGMKNLRMFRKLCGENGLGSVVLATTMWSLADPALAEAREKELVSTQGFWKEMIQKGSKVFRQDDGNDSAVMIIEYIVEHRRKVTLAIQDDMVVKGLALDETGAGQEMQAELATQRKYYEKKMQEIRDDMKEAMKNRDSEHQRELVEYKAEIEAKMAKERAELERMQLDKDDLRAELAAQYAVEREDLRHKAQAELMTTQHSHAMELTRLQHELSMKEYQRKILQQQYDDRGGCVVM